MSELLLMTQKMSRNLSDNSDLYSEFEKLTSDNKEDEIYVISISSGALQKINLQEMKDQKPGDETISHINHLKHTFGNFNAGESEDNEQNYGQQPVDEILDIQAFVLERGFQYMKTMAALDQISSNTGSNHASYQRRDVKGKTGQLDTRRQTPITESGSSSIT